MSEASDPRLEAYLQLRLTAARRRARWRVGLGIVVALVLAVGGSLATDAVRDPEGVVEMLPLHTGRRLQAEVVESLEAGAPNSARMAHRQIDRVPSEINAVVLRELQGWTNGAIEVAVDGLPTHLRALAEDDPEGFAQAMGYAAGAEPLAAPKARAVRLRAYLRANLRPRLVDELEPLPTGPTAYLVATANAVAGLGDDAPSAEQLLEHLALGLLTHLIAPA